MQCASSTAASEMPPFASAAAASGAPSVSGVVITSTRSPLAICARAASRALPRSWPSSLMQGTARRWSFSYWSRIRASSGEITSTGFGRIIDGIW